MLDYIHCTAGPPTQPKPICWLSVCTIRVKFFSFLSALCVCVCQLKSKPLSSKEEFDFHGGNESSCTTQHRTKQTSVTADYDSGSARYGVKGPGWWWVVKRLAHTQQLCVKRMCKNVPSEPSASMCWHRDQLITAKLVLEVCLNFTTLKFLTVHGISSIENSTSMKLQL